MLITALLSFFIKYILPPKLSSLSPGEAYELFDRACRQGNIKLIKQLYFFPPGTSPEEREKIANEFKYTPEDFALENFYGGWREKVTYEEIISEDTAIVGISTYIPFLYRVLSLSFVLFKTSPSPWIEVLMRKENGIWKVYKPYSPTEKELLENIKKNPSDARSYYYLGEIYEGRDRYVKAWKYYEKYLELAPNGFWAPEVKEWVKEYREEYKDLKKKEKEYLQYIEKYEDKETKATYLRYLGYFYFDTGQYIKAKKALEMSLELDPEQKATDVTVSATEEMKKLLQEIEKILKEKSENPIPMAPPSPSPTHLPEEKLP